MTGAITGSPDQLADGLAITVDDGSGPLRAVIGPDALAGRTIASGVDRDRDGTARAARQLRDRGRRLSGPGHDRRRAEPDDTHTDSDTDAQPGVTVAHADRRADRHPDADRRPDSDAGADDDADLDGGNPTPTPTVTPSSADVLPLRSVRGLPLGTRVRTTGVVVAESGRLGTPALIAIGDQDAGLVVRGSPASRTFARGTKLEVAGKLAAPYGQLEIRPTEADVRVLGSGRTPGAIAPRADGPRGVG